MSTKVVMEALSPTMEEGRLVEWKKNEGDAVAVGDVLAEVETDKAVMELVARAGGTLLKQVVSAGTTVPVSELVAVIGEPGEKVDAGGKADGAPAARKPEPKPDAGEEQATQPAPDRNRPTSMPPAPKAGAALEGNGQPAPAPRPSAPQPAPSGGRVKASPLARRMAAERGIDLAAVAGSGPEGRVVARDVEGSRPAAAAKAPARAPAAVRIPEGQAYQDVPLTQIRKTIAKRLVQSIGPIPTFYLTTEVDMERSAEAREALLAGGGEKVSFNDIILKAVATALRQHPECNAWWQDDHIRYWNEVHVAMAVAIEEGLITPVIRHTDLKSLREIAAEAKDLADAGPRAEAGARGVHRRHVLGLQPRHARHRRIHRGDQPARSGHPRGRADGGAAGGAPGRGRDPAADAADDVLRPPGDRRRDRRAVPADAQEDAGESAGAGVLNEMSP